LEELHKEKGMKGLLEFQNDINYVQFERLKDFFLNYMEERIGEIISKTNDVRKRGPITKNVEIINDLENFLYDQDNTVNHKEPERIKFKNTDICTLFEKLCEERWVVDSDNIPYNCQLNDYYYRTKVDKSAISSEYLDENTDL